MFNLDAQVYTPGAIFLRRRKRMATAGTAQLTSFQMV